MKPTPETDAEFRKLYAGYPTHPATLDLQLAEKFACKLERQRDELLAALERIRDGKDAPDIDATGEWQTGLHCGVEDRDCQDRYQGADYGHTVGVEKGLEWASNEARAAIAAVKGDAK